MRRFDFTKLAAVIGGLAYCGSSHKIALAVRTRQDVLDDRYIYEAREWNSNWDRQDDQHAMGTRKIVMIATPCGDVSSDGTVRFYEQLKKRALDQKLRVTMVAYEGGQEISKSLATCIGNDFKCRPVEDRLLASKPLENPYSSYTFVPDSEINPKLTLYHESMASYENLFRSYFSRNITSSSELHVIICPVNFISYCVYRALQLPKHVLEHVKVRRNSVTSFILKRDGCVKLDRLGDTCHQAWETFSSDI